MQHATHAAGASRHILFIKKPKISGTSPPYTYWCLSLMLLIWCHGVRAPKWLIRARRLSLMISLTISWLYGQLTLRCPFVLHAADGTLQVDMRGVLQLCGYHAGDYRSPGWWKASLMPWRILAQDIHFELLKIEESFFPLMGYFSAYRQRQYWFHSCHSHGWIPGHCSRFNVIYHGPSSRLMHTLFNISIWVTMPWVQ